MNEGGHDFDVMTCWCRRCGCSLAAAVDHRRDCTEAGNIIAISHIVSARRLGALLGDGAERIHEGMLWDE